MSCCINPLFITTTKIPETREKVFLARNFGSTIQVQVAPLVWLLIREADSNGREFVEEESHDGPGNIESSWPNSSLYNKSIP